MVPFSLNECLLVGKLVFLVIGGERGENVEKEARRELFL